MAYTRTGEISLTVLCIEDGTWELESARTAAADAMHALSEDNADERALFDIHFENWRMLLAELGFRCRNRRLGKVGCA